MVEQSAVTTLSKLMNVLKRLSYIPEYSSVLNMIIRIFYTHRHLPVTAVNIFCLILQTLTPALVTPGRLTAIQDRERLDMTTRVYDFMLLVDYVW